MPARRAPLLWAILFVAGCPGKPQPGDSATGGAGSVSVPAPAAPEGLTRDQYLQVEIAAECARLGARADLGQVDIYREQALKRLDKTRRDYLMSLASFMEDAAARTQIEARVADCRVAAGFVRRTGGDGEAYWEPAAGK